jgi:hypothetical protein
MADHNDPKAANSIFSDLDVSAALVDNYGGAEHNNSLPE